MKILNLKIETDSDNYIDDIINAIENITIVNDVELLEVYNEEGLEEAFDTN